MITEPKRDCTPQVLISVAPGKERRSRRARTRGALHAAPSEAGGVPGDRDGVLKTASLPPNPYLSHGALSANGAVSGGRDAKEVSAEGAA
jgi:hypothetical protein